MSNRTIFYFGSSFLVGFSLLVACSSSSSSGPVANNPGADAGAKTGADSGDLVTNGAQVASTLGCHECHDSSKGVMAGADSTGLKKPVNGAVTTIFAANLTPDPDTGLGDPSNGGWSDFEFQRAVRTGIDDGCLTLCQAMPRFTISDSDMAALTAYVRSLTPVKNAVTTQGCPDITIPDGAGGTYVPEAGTTTEQCPAPDADSDSDGGS